MIGSILGGIIGMSGAQAGGNMAGNAANNAAMMQQQEATRARAAMSPWTAAGGGAINKIANLLGLGNLETNGGNYNTYGLNTTNAKEKQDEALNAFQTSPGYSFRKQEGINALDRSAASRGLLLSGAQVKGIQGFGDGLASEEYRNYMGDLFAASGQGMGATSSANSTAGSLTARAANNIFQGGVARGSGYAAGANALASGIGQGINNVMFGFGRFGGGGGSGPNSLGGRIAVQG